MGFLSWFQQQPFSLGLPVGFIRQLEGTSQARTGRRSNGLQRLPAVHD